MAGVGETSPIADDEIVLRRVSETSGYYDPESDRPFAWVAFRPNEKDVRGLSVWRERYKTPEQAAGINARPGRRYFIFKLNVGVLREAGVIVEPSTDEGGAGHASLVNLNPRRYAEDKNAVQELARTIAEELVECVEGPFGPFEIKDPA